MDFDKINVIVKFKVFIRIFKECNRGIFVNIDYNI